MASLGVVVVGIVALAVLVAMIAFLVLVSRNR
ncbi:MAG: hypothetical protein QOD86_2754 [Miltoncostaeaceae bacterium]|jgi:hypothetical protein|nr:hypothetical protein [Miltoncostaeaceae bacterium]